MSKNRLERNQAITRLFRDKRSRMKEAGVVIAPPCERVVIAYLQELAANQYAAVAEFIQNDIGDFARSLVSNGHVTAGAPIDKVRFEELKSKLPAIKKGCECAVEV